MQPLACLTTDLRRNISRAVDAVDAYSCVVLKGSYP